MFEITNGRPRCVVCGEQIYANPSTLGANPTHPQCSSDWQDKLSIEARRAEHAAHVAAVRALKEKMKTGVRGMKRCPAEDCGNTCRGATKVCPTCGYRFPTQKELQLTLPRAPKTFDSEAA